MLFDATSGICKRSRRLTFCRILGRALLLHSRLTSVLQGGVFVSAGPANSRVGERVPKPIRAENREPSSKEWMLPYISFRTALHDEVWRENWTSQFMRPGLLLIAIFEFGSIAASAFLLHTARRY